MKLNTFRPPEYHCVKMHREGRAWPREIKRRAAPAAGKSRKPVSKPSPPRRKVVAKKRQSAAPKQRRANPFAGLKPNSGQFRAAHADFVSAADSRDPPGPRCGRPWRPADDLSRIAGAGEAARFGAGAARRAPGRHGLGDAAERARDARGALRRADAGRRAQYHQHAARSRNRRLYPGAWRSQGADHRPRVRGASRPGACAHEEAASGDRRGRPALHRSGRAAWRDRVRGFHRDRRSGLHRQSP